MCSIDVVVPCYQYGRFLGDCLGSILTQPVEDLHVLIIDNGSSDNTRDVAQQIASEDSRVELVSHRSNLGHHASYNEGIDWAKSDYFVLIDADDMMSPGCLLRATTVMESDDTIVFAHGTELETHLPKTALCQKSQDMQQPHWCISSGFDFIERVCRAAGNPVGATTVVRRTSTQKKVGYYHRELERAVDLNMWLRLAMHGNVAETAMVQGIRRRHADQLSALYRKHLVKDFDALLSNFEHFLLHEGACLPNSHNARRVVTRKLSCNAFLAGLKKLLKGHSEECIELFDFALNTLKGRTDLAKAKANVASAAN